MKIYDCFIFNNELDLLEVRLRETFDKVDHFVIVESDLTFTGLPKPLYLHDNWERFKPWADKITLIRAKDISADNDPWINEFLSRENLAVGTRDANPEDYILLSDADELFRASTFDLMRQYNEDYYGFRVPYFTFKLNYLQVRPQPRPWLACGSAVRKNNLSSFTELRNAKDTIGHATGKIIGHAGWHFNNIATAEDIRVKLASFSHTEDNTPEVLARLDINNLIARREGLLPGGEFVAVAFDDYFPISIRNDMDRWKDYIIPGEGSTRDIMKSYAAFARYQSGG